MKTSPRALGGSLPAISEHVIRKVYLPKISRCLATLSEREIWWRPNRASNSTGNLVLHLMGNMRQWIVAGLGGAQDIRIRALEFSEQGPIPRRVLLARLQRTVRQACAVIGRLSPSDLRRTYEIQGYSITGFRAVFHVTEHFSHHAGQIIYLTKLKKSRNLGLTRLPADKKRKGSRRKIRSV